MLSVDVSHAGRSKVAFVERSRCELVTLLVIGRPNRIFARRGGGRPLETGNLGEERGCSWERRLRCSFYTAEEGRGESRLRTEDEFHFR